MGPVSSCMHLRHSRSPAPEMDGQVSLSCRKLLHYTVFLKKGAEGFSSRGAMGNLVKVDGLDWVEVTGRGCERWTGLEMPYGTRQRRWALIGKTNHLKPASIKRRVIKRQRKSRQGAMGHTCRKLWHQRARGEVQSSGLPKRQSRTPQPIR